MPLDFADRVGQSVVKQIEALGDQDIAFLWAPTSCR
jgi:hypothetical protein